MRKGMSFTLTVVVVGVILMTTALTIITLGGASLGDFFNTITGQGEQQAQERQVQQACDDVIQRIQTRYCDAWVEPGNLPTAGDVMQRRSEADSHTATCNEENCPINAAGGSFSWTDADRPGEYSSADTFVEVEGNEFDCRDYGLPPSCPASQ